MKETIVSFELAKLILKKGFKERSGLCTHSYYNYKGVLRGDVTEAIKHRNDEVNIYQTIPAPTLSYLQKWVMKNHNIDVWVQPFIAKNLITNDLYLPGELYSYFLFKNGKFINDVSGFLSFDDALNAGLFEAVELL